MTMPLRGQSILRLEDERFLTGRGRFIEDIDAPGQAWMQVVRSPHAHALIGAIDAAAAVAMPGVLGVFTAADLVALGPLPCNVPVASVRPMIVPPRTTLANGRVRHVGDPVAFVVAETRDAARTAAEAVFVDYDPLPAAVDPAAALRDDAPQIWDEAPGNLTYRFQKGDQDAVRAAMAGAAHVVELELVNNRIVVAATETRGGIGSYDEHGYHLQFSGAGVHGLRSQLAEAVFREPAARVRVSCPDVGGGFGVKNAMYPEWAMLLWAARRLGRPVKWISERIEDFITTAQGRANLTQARLGLDAEGNFLALDVATLADLGAYLSSGGPGSSTNAPGGAASGLDTYVWNLLDLITFPNGCHIAEVEIDPETGAVTLERYTAVDDFGTLLNPALTLGQIHGGVVQGIGQALLERTVYDPQSGQLLSGSLMDYTLPRASDIPALDIRFDGVPTTANPLGVKGAGQAGAIAAPQAVVCAVLDALAPLGVEHIDMPVTSERVWRAMQRR